MVRPLRLSFEDAFYHITARGNRRDNIFYSPRDKDVFLDKMNETFIKYSFVCYAYCLMDNHYHLFVKTPFANITEGMHYLNTSYSNWFKAKHRIVGAIFQGRYKAILVDEDSYALKLSTYIHLNPLRRGMVKHIKEYKWSSYLDYIGVRKSLTERLHTSFLLSQFDQDLSKSRKKYKKFVLENIDIDNPLENTYKAIALGDNSFIEKIIQKIEVIGKNREIRETKISDPYVQEEIIDKIVEIFKIKRPHLFKHTKNNIYRQLALHLIKKYSSLSLKEIGGLFDMDYSAVSQAVKRFENKINMDKKISNMKEMIIETLKKGNVKC